MSRKSEAHLEGIPGGSARTSSMQIWGGSSKGYAFAAEIQNEVMRGRLITINAEVLTEILRLQDGRQSGCSPGVRRMSDRFLFRHHKSSRIRPMIGL